MAPTSRLILTRHAQAEHNVDLDYSIPDAPLTPLGRKQAASLAPQLAHLQPSIDLLVSSPLKRTLQTTTLGYGPAITRLGGPQAVICLPAAQECNDFPCDTGSPRAALAADPEFSAFDLAPLTDDWTGKAGFYAATPAAWRARARFVRQFLRDRPEHTIVLVAHGDILRWITGGKWGPSDYPWRNAEARAFVFDPASVAQEDCLLQAVEGDAAIAGGYAPTSTEADIVHQSPSQL